MVVPSGLPPATPPRRTGQGRSSSISIIPATPSRSPITRRSEARRSPPQRQAPSTRDGRELESASKLAAYKKKEDIGRRIFGLPPRGAASSTRDSKRHLPQIGVPLPRRCFLRTLVIVGTVVIAGLIVWLVAIFDREPAREPLVIPYREWDTVPYTHLDYSSPIALRPMTRLFHVSKEFGPATMGGLGVMLTSLVVAQTQSGQLDISVILPHYSYLNSIPELKDQIELVAELQVPVVSYRGHVRHVACPVSRLRWKYVDLPDFLGAEVETAEAIQERFIDIYLIGPGKSHPFHVAFRAKDSGDVYSAYKPLRQEWKDLWFASATAEFIGLINAHPTTIDGSSGLVDLVHLHGATNAMVAYYIRQQEAQNHNATIPAIIYTLHDSLDEVEYSNLVSNAVSFLSPIEHQSPLAHLLVTRLPNYVHSAQLFPAAMAVDLADMVTFVSRSIAADITEGRFTFRLQELIMPSIAAQAKRGHFVGITNGIDFTDLSKNPFVAPLLVKRGAAFPRIGSNLLRSSTLEDEALSFVAAKRRAKQALIDALPMHFSEADLRRPILLFIGRFQYNKGCEFLEPILEMLLEAQRTAEAFKDDGQAAHHQFDARLVVMGARNNYPIQELRRLQQWYPRHFTLIDDASDLQSQWGSMIRMASDFSFVPSFSEAFGLVAAEGLLFGAPVISTGVGGLAEFLVPFDKEAKKPSSAGNAHLFQLYGGVGRGEGSGTPGGELSLQADQARPSLEELDPAIRRCNTVVASAIRGWQERAHDWARVEQERFVRRLVVDALELSWHRPNGPVEEFTRVYDAALRVSRARPIGGRAHWVDHHPHPSAATLTKSAPPGIVATAVAHLPIYKIWTTDNEIRRQPQAPIVAHLLPEAANSKGNGGSGSSKKGGANGSGARNKKKPSTTSALKSHFHQKAKAHSTHHEHRKPSPHRRPKNGSKQMTAKSAARRHR
ncbi:BQ5605_C012g06919 [Microbotryum silenes-dioicae]|uniref:BQ5605_C012g06919 protein n=1 Tax=Microbotryum silenes-dioicae TaxID=796604 RepID=A0A2X0MLX4_9BASI|nr:BQ5605_C012g06919 [Microbotryum silenes-dioicae]